MNRLRYVNNKDGYKLYYDFCNDKCMLVTGEHQRVEPIHVHDFDELKKEFTHLPGFNALFVNEPLYRKN